MKAKRVPACIATSVSRYYVGGKGKAGGVKRNRYPFSS
jgi:hypothetical protein